LSRRKNDPWQGVPIEGVIHDLGGEFFALHPMCVFQGLATSDDKTPWIDRVRSIVGGLAFIQKCNEVYCNHKGSIIFIHFLAAVGLIVLS
jgi:hypothetical protein